MINKPKMLENIDWKVVKAYCQEYIDFISSEDYYDDNDYVEYIFEEAMIACFGKKVWEYINKRT